VLGIKKSNVKLSLKIENTSFLILVKDEESFSRKLVKHINKQNVKAEFVIADGSKKKQKRIFDKLNQKKKYYYFGEDKNISIFFRKVLKSINKCTKQFIFFCDQDNLLNFHAIKIHEEFLLKNNDYSAVRGIIYNFKYENGKINLLRNHYKNYKDFDSFFLRYFFNPNFRAYYCLHRKFIFKKVWYLVNKYKLKDVRSLSLVSNIITLSSGKIKTFNDVSILRWSGLKKSDKKKLNDHFVNEIHKNRYKWFLDLFYNKETLLKKILKDQKIFFSNFYIFKLFFFIFDILINRISRKIKKLFKRNKNKPNKLKPEKIFKELRLNQIINQKELLK
jgi:hypothetical protein